MKNDGIAVTACKGSGLLCDVVIHVDMQDTTHKLKEKITHVLEKTEELGKISVAFPALGINEILQFVLINFACCIFVLLVLEQLRMQTSRLSCCIGNIPYKKC